MRDVCAACVCGPPLYSFPLWPSVCSTANDCSRLRRSSLSLCSSHIVSSLHCHRHPLASQLSAEGRPHGPTRSLLISFVRAPQRHHAKSRNAFLFHPSLSLLRSLPLFLSLFQTHTHTHTIHIHTHTQYTYTHTLDLPSRRDSAWSSPASSSACWFPAAHLACPQPCESAGSFPRQRAQQCSISPTQTD